MKKLKVCTICGTGKSKRTCKLHQGELICIDCCLKEQSYYCNGCAYYQDIILKFKCSSCGKTFIDDQPSAITELMATKIFRLEYLDGKNFNNGFAISGEIYTTSIAFPFEGRLETPIWFYYDPENSYDTLQMIQGEIVNVKQYDEYKAEVEIFVHQTGNVEIVENVFPEKEMPEPLYNVKYLFPIGSLAIQTFGIYILVSSMMQDGGNQALIMDDGKYSRIIFYAEGFFNHWQEYAGNIKIKKSFLQQIQMKAHHEK